MAGGVMLAGLLPQLAAQVPVLWRMGLLPRITCRAARCNLPMPKTVYAAFAFGWRQRCWGGVAQLSLMINTQIASYLALGSDLACLMPTV